jgi:ABC-type hemin transport system ATPase subunit
MAKIYLKNLTIKGLFDALNYDIDFDNPDHLSILLGPNGSGKTTILDLVKDYCDSPFGCELGSLAQFDINVERTRKLFSPIYSSCSFTFEDEKGAVLYTVTFTNDQNGLREVRYEKAGLQHVMATATAYFSAVISDSWLANGEKPTTTIKKAIKTAKDVVAERDSFFPKGFPHFGQCQYLSANRVPNKEGVENILESEKDSPYYSTDPDAAKDEKTFSLLPYQWLSDKLTEEFRIAGPIFRIDTDLDGLADGFIFAQLNLSMQERQMLNDESFQNIISKSLKDSPEAVFQKWISLMERIQTRASSKVWKDIFERVSSDAAFKTKLMIRYFESINSNPPMTEKPKKSSFSMSDLGLAISTEKDACFFDSQKISLAFAKTFSADADLFSKIQKVYNTKFQSIIPCLMHLNTDRGIFFLSGSPNRHQCELTDCQLSSGLRNILAILYELYSIEGPNEQKLLLIDEPEVSLHIEWQAEIFPLIQEVKDNSSLQIILATQSPFVLGSHTEALVEMERTLL